MQQFINIFDLDCTLIDSSHRINESGDYTLGLDLDYWIENCTEEQIMKDKLLPLADLFYEFQKTNFTNIAVTARQMTDADFEFLKKHNFNFEMVLHRENSRELDHVMKEKKIQELFDSSDYIPFLAFDDKEANLDIFRKFGFRCYNALELNKNINGVDVPCNHKYMEGTDSFLKLGQRED